MRVSTAERSMNYVVLLLFAAFALAPFVVIVTGALQPDAEAPGGLANLREAWRIGHFGSYVRNSAMVSLFVVSVSTVLSILAGYALGAMRFRGATPVFYLMLLGIMMPAEAIVISLFYDLRALHLTDTFWAIVMPQVAQSVAFGTFWLRSFFRTSSRSLIEAARLDGAGHWRVLWQVLVPLARPAILTLVILSFLWTWNEFLIPLVLAPTNEAIRTAPLGLSFFSGQYTQGFALLAAGSVIIAAPIVVLYLFLQRHVIAGMLEGAVKD